MAKRAGAKEAPKSTDMSGIKTLASASSWLTALGRGLATELVRLSFAAALERPKTFENTTMAALLKRAMETQEPTSFAIRFGVVTRRLAARRLRVATERRLEKGAEAVTRPVRTALSSEHTSAPMAWKRLSPRMSFSSEPKTSPLE